ncbi:MAG: hypothetical protein BV456_12990 [Thermoplasmata archaeon M8B2D]|nr:MAG: hypothetical protein BV456_12990 [Thermoplasmata archaeon M8B2D]
MGIAIIILAAVFLILTLKPSPTTNAVNEEIISGNNQATGTGAVKEFDMIAKQWEFDPSTIEVNQGDTVLLHITSTDVDHGIALPAFGVEEHLNPGETVDVQFVADKKGTYTFFCDVYCGPGHKDMTGTLVVN